MSWHRWPFQQVRSLPKTHQNCLFNASISPGKSMWTHKEYQVSSVSCDRHGFNTIIISHTVISSWLLITEDWRIEHRMKITVISTRTKWLKWTCRSFSADSYRGHRKMNWLKSGITKAFLITMRNVFFSPRLVTRSEQFSFARVSRKTAISFLSCKSSVSPDWRAYFSFRVSHAVLKSTEIQQTRERGHKKSEISEIPCTSEGWESESYFRSADLFFCFRNMHHIVSLPSAILCISLVAYTRVLQPDPTLPYPTGRVPARVGQG